MRRLKMFEKGIKEDLVNCLKDVKLIEQLEVQEINVKMLNFIIENYLYDFLDNIKRNRIDEKFNDFIKKEIGRYELSESEQTQLIDLIKQPQAIDNVQPIKEELNSHFILEIPNRYFNYEIKLYRGYKDFYTDLLIDIVVLICETIKKLDKKRKYQNTNSMKFIKKLNNKINLLKKEICTYLETDTLDSKKIDMTLKLYDFITEKEFENSINYDAVEEIIEYYNIKSLLKYGKIENIPNKDFDKFEEEARKTDFSEFLGFNFDDDIAILFHNSFQLMQSMEVALKILSTPSLARFERDDIQEFFYEINDFFNLGIKDRINKNDFVNCIAIGYTEYSKKQTYRKKHKK